MGAGGRGVGLCTACPGRTVGVPVKGMGLGEGPWPHIRDPRLLGRDGSTPGGARVPLPPGAPAQDPTLMGHKELLPGRKASV